ncbi:MAG: hypothetical protein GF355_12130 [Candidatus Eisenbacteria bacterium]|nr:hypothetical protein [Candidatus Eisenbacteria bacterium]
MSLKQIRDRVADPEHPSETETAWARQQLVPVARLAGAFEDGAARSEKLQRAAEQALAEAAGEGGADRGAISALRERLKEAEQQSQRYRRHVKKFYGRAVSTYGPPPPPDAAAGGPPSRGAVSATRVWGEIWGGLGISKYERPNAPEDPNSARPRDESTTDFQGHVQAVTVLPTKTRLQLNLEREHRLERREISLSNIALRAHQQLPAGVAFDAGIGRRGYKEELDERAGYGELRVHSAVEYTGTAVALGGHVEHRSRSHTDDEDQPQGQRRDYAITVLGLDGALTAGEGRLSAGWTRTTRRAEQEATDHDRDALALEWRAKPGGLSLRAQAEFWSRPVTVYDSLSLQTKTEEQAHHRYKLRMTIPAGGSPGSAQWVPEALIYRYPDLEDRGYLDAGIAYRSRTGAFGGGDRMSTSHRRLYYRLHESEEAFDFVSYTSRSSARPKGSGFYRQFGMSVKAYTRQEDYEGLDDVGENPTPAEVYAALGVITQAFQSPRPPHVLDMHWRGGWRFGAASAGAPAFELGPSLGHVFYVDSERYRLQDMANDLMEKLPEASQVDDPLGDQDYLLLNPINRARAGVSGAVEVRGLGNLRGRIDLQYSADVLYNADPVQIFSTFDLRGSGRFVLKANLFLEGELGYHRTRLGDEGSAGDFNRMHLRVLVRHLFDVDVARISSLGRSS